MYPTNEDNALDDSGELQAQKPFDFKLKVMADLAPADYPLFNPYHHLYASGPSSAPAASHVSGDYFSMVYEAPDRTMLPQDAVRSQGQGHNTGSPKRILSLSKKVRHRSNLSHSYVNNESDMLFGNAQFVKDDVDPSERLVNALILDDGKTMSRKKRNPGFKLKLDNLNPTPTSVRKFQLQQQHFASPSSDTTYDRSDSLAMHEHEGHLRHQFTGGVDQYQENVTPLMFPPATESQGYFGNFNDDGSKSSAQPDMLGGYLNVSSRITEPHAGINGNGVDGSDIDSYLNYAIDEFESPIHFDGQIFRSRPDYDDEIDDKADIHFTPVHHQTLQYKSYGENSNYKLNMPQDPPADVAHEQNIGAPEHAENYDANASLFSHYHNNIPYSGQETYYGENSAQQNGHNALHTLNNSYKSRGYNVDAKAAHGFPPEQDVDYYYATNQEAKSNTSHTLAQNAVHRTITGIGEPSTSVLYNDSEGDKATQRRRAMKGGTVCSICDKYIVRDFSRHLRIHDEVGRFRCIFPPIYCKHKSRKFNRPYDYKKHLLNVHFKFEDSAARLAPNLTEKLQIKGQCSACGERFVANDWLEQHILTTDLTMKCHELQRMETDSKDDDPAEAERS